MHSLLHSGESQLAAQGHRCIPTIVLGYPTAQFSSLRTSYHVLCNRGTPAYRKNCSVRCDLQIEVSLSDHLNLFRLLYFLNHRRMLFSMIECLYVCKLKRSTIAWETVRHCRRKLFDRIVVQQLLLERIIKSWETLVANRD